MTAPYYLIVKVTYDYHRFQQNLSCSHDPEFIAGLAEELSRTHNLPIEYYIAEGAAQALLDNAAQRGEEKPHLWIQIIYPEVCKNI